MDKIYLITRYLTYPAVFVRKAVEFLLCAILNIEPAQATEEMNYDELTGHTPHGEFLYPIKAAVYNILVFAFQLAGAAGFLGAGITALIRLDVSLINPVSLQIDPMFLVYILFMYLGICFASNLFPSANSVENFWGLCIAQAGIISRIIFIIPAVIFRVGIFLENFGITVVLSVVLPIIFKIGL